jgi:hypothetical protein
VDRDAELLIRINKNPDFFGSVFEKDHLDDWNLARGFGEFLVRTLPPTEIMGPAVLARACRHLGNREHARQQIQHCRRQLASRSPEPWEIEMLLPALTAEEECLSEQG